jgi:hypothetical protein
MPLVKYLHCLDKEEEEEEEGVTQNLLPIT